MLLRKRLQQLALPAHPQPLPLEAVCSSIPPPAASWPSSSHSPPPPPPPSHPQATIEWEAQEEGFLAKILMPEGSRDIPVGTTVALLVEDAGDVAAFASYSPGAAAAAPTKAEAPKEEAPAAAAAAGAPGSFPAHQVRVCWRCRLGFLLGWIRGWDLARMDHRLGSGGDGSRAAAAVVEGTRTQPDPRRTWQRAARMSSALPTRALLWSPSLPSIASKP